MTKLSEDELIELANRYSYSALLERYKVMEKYMDIKEGSTVIDGGAFHGDMAQYFSKKVGRDGNVYSFEPLKYNLIILNEIIYKYDLRNVNIIPKALWNKRDRIPFYLSDYQNAGSPLKEFRKVKKEKFLKIQADSLDNIVKNLNIKKVDYVWMNIEGSEINALKGMKKTLKDNKCKLCISTHKVNDDYTSTNDVIKILNEYGYKTELVNSHEKWVYAEK